VITDSSCSVRPWSHFAVEALSSAVMGTRMSPMGDFEHVTLEPWASVGEISTRRAPGR